MSENPKITTGAVREMLFNTMKKAYEGKMNTVDGKMIIGSANQMTHNLTAELKQRELEIRIGATRDTLAPLGDLSLSQPQTGKVCADTD